MASLCERLVLFIDILENNNLELLQSKLGVKYDDTEKLVEQYYPILDSLVNQVNEAKDYKLATKENKNYQFNYFYSSSSKP